MLLGLDAGEARGLLEAMTALAGDYANVSTFQAGLCLTAAFAGEFGLAKRLLSDQSASGFGNVNADVEGLAVAAFYAHAAAIVEDRSNAEVLLSLLETVKPRAVRVGALTGWWDLSTSTSRAAPAPRPVRRSEATFGELSRRSLCRCDLSLLSSGQSSSWRHCLTDRLFQAPGSRSRRDWWSQL